jgi:hypothetical protein
MRLRIETSKFTAYFNGIADLLDFFDNNVDQDQHWAIFETDDEEDKKLMFGGGVD